MPTIKCDKCGKEFHRKPSKLKTFNYCSLACASKLVTGSCQICGMEVTRCQSQMLTNVFCSLDCSRKWNSQRFTDLNIELNPARMTTDTRTRLRNSKLGSGAGLTYEKTFGVHTHRIVAEKMVGRKLQSSEVVHHIDEDKR